MAWNIHPRREYFPRHSTPVPTLLNWLGENYRGVGTFTSPCVHIFELELSLPLEKWPQLHKNGRSLNVLSTDEWRNRLSRLYSPLRALSDGKGQGRGHFHGAFFHRNQFHLYSFLRLWWIIPASLYRFRFPSAHHSHYPVPSPRGMSPPRSASGDVTFLILPTSATACPCISIVSKRFYLPNHFRCLDLASSVSLPHSVTCSFTTNHEKFSLKWLTP